jgi:hypothetical protein
MADFFHMGSRKSTLPPASARIGSTCLRPRRRQQPLTARTRSSRFPPRLPRLKEIGYDGPLASSAGSTVRTTRRSVMP